MVCYHVRDSLRLTTWTEIELHTNKYKGIFEVDPNSDLPIWVQLRNRMAYLIRTGFFTEGEQLPSVRCTAAEARINYNTVTKAYHELEADNLIVNVRGRGMFVRRGILQNEIPELTIANTALEDAIMRYHLTGMTYEEIEQHICSIIADKAKEAKKLAEEKMEYHDAH